MARSRRLMALAAAATAVTLLRAAAASAGGTKPTSGGGGSATPIKHLVIIFQENVSFDHYFGTYPKAANTSGQRFDAERRTPGINGLSTTKGAGGVGTLLTNNPN